MKAEGNGQFWIWWQEDKMPTYLDMLNEVAQDDVESLRKAEDSYGDSWKKRGGVGAFMMLARKWDRIEKQISRELLHYNKAPNSEPNAGLVEPVHPYDIFRHLEVDQRPEGLSDDIKDLRRYLLLVEAEMRSRGNVGRLEVYDVRVAEGSSAQYAVKEGDPREFILSANAVETYYEYGKSVEARQKFLKSYWEKGAEAK